MNANDQSNFFLQFGRKIKFLHDLSKVLKNNGYNVVCSSGQLCILKENLGIMVEWMEMMPLTYNDILVCRNIDVTKFA